MTLTSTAALFLVDVDQKCRRLWMTLSTSILQPFSSRPNTNPYRSDSSTALTFLNALNVDKKYYFYIVHIHLKIIIFKDPISIQNFNQSQFFIQIIFLIGKCCVFRPALGAAHPKCQSNQSFSTFFVLKAEINEKSNKFGAKFSKN